MEDRPPTESTSATAAAPEGGGVAAGVRGARDRARRYGWGPLLALAATQLLESGERQSLAQAVDGIQDEFLVSDTAVGLLPSAALIVGLLGSIPFGLLADRTKRTWLLAGAMAIWTAAILGTGLMTAFAGIFVLRMILGAVEANSPAAISLLADYYPVTRRARMFSLYQSGALAGAIIGLGLGGLAVQLGGWRWSFYMWIPLGVATVLWLLRTPEPHRGDQDRDFETDMSGDEGPEPEEGEPEEATEDALGASASETVAAVESANVHLPEPRRVGTVDYATAGLKEVGRELLRIRTMWLALLSLTISQFLLTGLQFWGVEFFKRVHDLDAGPAGGLTATLGIGAVFGIVGGGFIADRFFRRGVVNARIYVTALGSIAAAIVLVPAFWSTTLLLTVPLMVVGGALLTLPVAPSEALLADVVVPQLRGRAATVRTIVRSIANVGPLLIGFMSDRLGLQTAIVAITPIYALGGTLMFLSTRHYAHELAFVVAETRRQGRATEGSPDPDAGGDDDVSR